MTTNTKPIERIHPDDPHIKPQTIAHHKARYEFVLTLRNTKGLAIDLGCGTGYGAAMLEQAGYDAWAIDIHKPTITEARKRYPKVRFNLVDLQEPDFKPGNTKNLPKAELIVMFEVIEHLTHIAGIRLIKKISRSLKPGGVFVLSTPRDINGKYNNFHKSKWPYHEIKNVCSSFFDKVEIYGQDWDTAKITNKFVPKEDFYIAVCRNTH